MTESSASVRIGTIRAVARQGGYRHYWICAALALSSLAGCDGDIGPSSDPGVVVVDPLALTVAFSSRFGGSSNDQLRDISVDSQGYVYLTGGTQSADFPVSPDAQDKIFNDGIARDAYGGKPVGSDAFVMKLDPTGHVVWSTFVGGPFHDRAYAVEIDPAGNVYVAGRAGDGFPVTPGALQTTFAGGGGESIYGPQDGFVCKLTSAGAVVFCTYFGNRDGAPIRDLAVDSAGMIYVFTSVAVDTFPSEWFARAFQPARRGGRDALIARLDASGSRVLWASYLGGSDDEMNTGSIRLDRFGSILLVAVTRSPDAAVPNGFDKTLDGRSDLYVAKISNDGSRLEFGSYLGGSSIEGTETHQLATDYAGNVIVASLTTSDDLPASPTTIQRRYGGSGGAGTGARSNHPGDAFIARISSDGSKLLALTYLGGRLGDGAEGVAADSAGNVYLSGATYSDDFPSITSRLEPGRDNSQIFVAKVSADLTRLIYSIGFGGTKSSFGRAVALGRDGTVYAGGHSESTDWPGTNSLRTSAGGLEDGVIVRLAPRR